MKVFLDDERSAPEGWARVFWPAEAITILETKQVTDLSLDHDLGNEYITGYDVLIFLERKVFEDPTFPVPRIFIHSANPVGRKRMERAIESIYSIVSKGNKRKKSRG